MSSSPGLRVSRILHNVTAEGPGSRSAIWVQGCSIRCRGCINSHLFSTAGGYLVDPVDVVQQAVESGDEGLTLLGGEPFDQAAEGAELARLAQRAGLGVICFTGYTHETLQTKNALTFLDHIDLLVDGPYLAESPEPSRALVGSTNQRFINLTGRYEDFDPAAAKNRVEIRIEPRGTIEAAGFLDRSHLGELESALATRRVHRRVESEAPARTVCTGNL